ncbi:MAG: flagellar brake protein, partial [Spirochaetota bacterium]
MREDTCAQKRNKEAILDVGLVIFIQPKGNPKIIRYKSAVVGWKTDHLVIIEMPVLNGVYVNLADGCTCIVRYIYCGNAYGFETKVLRNINDTKLPLIYLSYPKSVEKISLRRYHRIQTQIPAFIEVPVEGNIRRLEGNILDLSVGGCLLDMNGQEDKAVSLDIDIRVKISFTLANSGEQVEGILAVVKRVQKTQDNMMAGVQFIDLSPDMLTKISSFCESL